MKKEFKKPFIGTSEFDGITILHSNKNDLSAILEMDNPIVQYAADPELYRGAHSIFNQIIKILGSGYIIQKTDIISLNKFSRPENMKSDGDFLEDEYFKHFEGRSYKKIQTYLTIIRQNNKGRFFIHDTEDVRQFSNTVKRILEILLNTGKTKVKILGRQEIDYLHLQCQCFNFNNENLSVSNISSDNVSLKFGEKELKFISLFDIDELNMPNKIRPFTIKRDYGSNFPMGNMHWLFQVPNVETVVYNQYIFIPNQARVKQNLESKKKKHTSMPDTRNEVSVNDIEEAFLDMAKNNELLVYVTFTLGVYGKTGQLEEGLNSIKTSLFSMGIVPGENTYNQMELFRASIPGNGDELQHYDKMLTSRSAAICFILTERLQKSEESDYLLYYTDRQGSPIGIDTTFLPQKTGRIGNLNKFVLGPSGSGKSFFMNSYVQQEQRKGADIVLIDTGHSYLETCRYFNGRYLTYTERAPITMNPFRIEEAEYNIEKKDSLRSIIGACWKGQGGETTQTEDTVLGRIIAGYYKDFFSGKTSVETLSFNTFYEYSCREIQYLLQEKELDFDYQNYSFILSKFYKTGEYPTLLNEQSDVSLFNEPFIVFEIDNIKESKELFPIVTLIIMDVFIQKMRHRKSKKILVIEEAWKAIASPMMAGYIKYLYKTVRKFNGEAIIVTQELDDIIGNPIVKKSIISNSDTICLLDQSKFKKDYKGIEDLLSLTEIEKNKIFTINSLDNKKGRNRFKEVYIRRGNVGEVYGVEVPLAEYFTYTTKQSERALLNKYIETYGDYLTALRALLKDFNESGQDLDHFSRNFMEGPDNSFISLRQV